jgi:hypothetical protein
MINFILPITTNGADPFVCTNYTNEKFKKELRERLKGKVVVTDIYAYESSAFDFSTCRHVFVKGGKPEKSTTKVSFVRHSLNGLLEVAKSNSKDLTLIVSNGTAVYHQMEQYGIERVTLVRFGKINFSHLSHNLVTFPAAEWTTISSTASARKFSDDQFGFYVFMKKGNNYGQDCRRKSA